jgi:hypothetical protein
MIRLVRAEVWTKFQIDNNNDDDDEQRRTLIHYCINEEQHYIPLPILLFFLFPSPPLVMAADLKTDTSTLLTKV